MTGARTLIRNGIVLPISATHPRSVLDPGSVLLEHLCGSLEPGKRADVITVDLRALHTTPLVHGPNSNVAAHLVFSASGHDVDHVWVDGRLLVEGGRVLSVDTEVVRKRAQEAAEKLFARREAMLRH